MTVLVVDDEPDILRLIEDYLSQSGWTVLIADNGASGLDMVHDNKVDIVVSDIFMPVMDGLKFFKYTRELPNLENIPFLFVSGYDDDMTRMIVQSATNVGFL